MTLFKSILAATDFSVSATHAVHRAARLAKQHGARLRVVHVINPARLEHLREWVAPLASPEIRHVEACERLQQLAVQLSSRYDVTADLGLRTGDPVEELQRESARADLLVIGQRRRHALAEMVLGRSARRLVERSNRSVLVVKQAADGDYRRALVPIDFTPASDAAAFVASALTSDIDLQVFHAFGSNANAVLREADVSASVIRESRANEEAALQARMRRSMARLGLDSRKLSFALGRGSPVKATLQQVHSHGVDVLVASKQRRSRTATSVLGYTNTLLARTNCDMLIVSGWLSDPRRPSIAAQRWPAAGPASPGGVHTVGAIAGRAPAWTRPSLSAAGPEGRAAAPMHHSRRVC